MPEVLKKTKKADGLFSSERVLTDSPNWIFNVITGEEGLFKGKEGEINRLISLIQHRGVAALEGGPRSGKSSISMMTANKLVEEKVVSSTVFLCSYWRLDDVKMAISDSQGGLKEGEKLLICVDEIDFTKEDLIEYFGYLKTLKDDGHKLLILLNCDYLHHPGIPEQIRKELTDLINGAVVVNRLMSDEDIRAIIRKDQPVFSKKVEDYLVRQAGGHPALASCLCINMFIKAKEVMSESGEVNWETFFADFEREITPQIGFLKLPVKIVREAGFDPETGNFSGTSQANPEVYVNMLPRQTSDIFYQWLNNEQASKKTV